MLLAANYTKECRDLAGERRRAFAAAPSASNQVWGYGLLTGTKRCRATWQIAGAVDL